MAPILTRAQDCFVFRVCLDQVIGALPFFAGESWAMIFGPRFTTIKVELKSFFTRFAEQVCVDWFI